MFVLAVPLSENACHQVFSWLIFSFHWDLCLDLTSEKSLLTTLSKYPHHIQFLFPITLIYSLPTIWHKSRDLSACLIAILTAYGSVTVGSISQNLEQYLKIDRHAIDIGWMNERVAPSVPSLDYELTESIKVTKTYGVMQNVGCIIGGQWNNRRGMEAKLVMVTQ